MNADLFERYNKQLQEEHLNEFFPQLIAKGVGALTKGVGNLLGGGGAGPQQAPKAETPQQKDATINAMLQADVQSILQKASTNQSKYSQRVQQALGMLKDGQDENQAGEGKPAPQKK
jgi:urease alpha subunit